MKKTLITFLVLVSFIAPVLALDWWGGVSSDFELVSKDPLYKEAKADPYAFLSHIYVTHMPKEDSAFFIRALVKEGSQIKYVDFPTKSDVSEMYENPNNLNLKPAVQTAFAKITVDGAGKFPKIEAETNVHAYFNSLFKLGGGGDCIGFDGSYFLGETVRIAENYTVRFGLHHFSGHFSDEALYDFYAANKYAKDDSSQKLTKGENTYELLGFASYVRDNDFQVSFSMNILDSLRIYSSVDVPMHKSWFRPFVCCPSDHETGATHGEDGFMDLANSDGVNLKNAEDKAQIEAEKALRGPEYMALRIAGGLEFEKEISIGTVFAGLDFQAHQDGQTKHQMNSYSKKNSWDFEYTIGGGLEFADNFIGNKKISVEVFYHYGRPALTQFSYKNGIRSVSFGFSVR